jgi:carbamoyl-phosphate synthase / aspartate carbamoyltransferase
MGIDLIEMATKVIMGRPIVPYPQTDLPQDFVGVKAPQFSFSRLSGADPVLGVEMASTGEVACFGRDRYEAYLKATISTGFKLPEKNILLSIGTYKDKAELLPSIRRLHQLGFNLFATAGTADFLEANEIKAKYLEVLGSEDKDQKLEYSLTQHLASNKIDLYINLPSANRFRRPANYMSKGYRTRRMAVDYQTPLITNVKVAKILIEALARHFDLEIGNIDFQTSHRSITLPGLINVAAFVPGIAQKDSHDLSLVTKASVAAGFTMIRVMPVGIDSLITDARSLKVAQYNAQAGVYCDYNFSVAATDSNSEQIVHVKGDVGSLFIPFNHLSSGNINKVATVTAHFASWPAYKPIVTDARTTDLASILLLASLHDRKVHVMNVTSKDDISLIALSKEKGLKVTCDVSVYSLFLSQADYPNVPALPTAADQKALWTYLPSIDVFSIGSIPYQVSGSNAVPTIGIADALPLLLTAVSEGKLTIEDITQRLHDNPKVIFELHEQTNTSVEIDIDRPYVLQVGDVWSPFVGRTFRGAVSRVTFQGKTACLDGEVMLDGPRGTDMSSHLLHPASTTLGPTSPVVQPQVEGALVRKASLIDMKLDRRMSMSTRARPATRARQLDEVIDVDTPVLASAPLYQPQAQSVISPSLQSLLATSPFKNRHVLSVNQYTRQDLHILFTVAQEMRLGVQRQGVLPILQSRVLCTMFYEPSTRTSASFDAAMQRLGGRTVVINMDHSSTKKGESLQDTIRTLGCYGDAVVLRHPDDESASTAAKFSPVPIINGGNGSREHPTQAFLDLFTIREELGTVTGLTVTFTGDLKYGRTVHSLVKLLQYYEVRINLVSPEALGLPSEVREQIVISGQLAIESDTLTPEIVAKSDVLYCTRVQKERFPSFEEYERLKDRMIVDNSVLKYAKSSMIVMHPLPRNNEISEEVDFDQRAAYFRQMRYGLYTRMALLALVLAP